MLHKYTEITAGVPAALSDLWHPYCAVLCGTCAGSLSNYFEMVRGDAAINTRCSSCGICDPVYTDLHLVPDGTQHTYSTDHTIAIVADVPDPDNPDNCILSLGDVIHFRRGVVMQFDPDPGKYLCPVPLQPVIDHLILHEIAIGYDIRSCYRMAQIDCTLDRCLDPDPEMAIGAVSFDPECTAIDSGGCPYSDDAMIAGYIICGAGCPSYTAPDPDGDPDEIECEVCEGTCIVPVDQTAPPAPPEQNDHMVDPNLADYLSSKFSSFRNRNWLRGYDAGVKFGQKMHPDPTWVPIGSLDTPGMYYIFDPDGSIGLFRNTRGPVQMAYVFAAPGADLVGVFERQGTWYDHKDYDLSNVLCAPVQYPAAPSTPAPAAQPDPDDLDLAFLVPDVHIPESAPAADFAPNPDPYYENCDYFAFVDGDCTGCVKSHPVCEQCDANRDFRIADWV